MSTRHSARILGRSIPLPKSKPVRVGLGALLLSGGLLGFLPVLGYWMVPVGIVILSVDIPRVRRFRRRMEVRLVPVWRRIAARWRDWRADQATGSAADGKNDTPPPTREPQRRPPARDRPR